MFAIFEVWLTDILDEVLGCGQSDNGLIWLRVRDSTPIRSRDDWSLREYVEPPVHPSLAVFRATPQMRRQFVHGTSILSMYDEVWVLPAGAESLIDVAQGMLPKSLTTEGEVYFSGVLDEHYAVVCDVIGVVRPLAILAGGGGTAIYLDDSIAEAVVRALFS